MLTINHRSISQETSIAGTAHALSVLAIVMLLMNAVIPSFGDITFTKHLIADNYNNPWSVCGSDMDKDHDMDVVASGRFGNCITW